MTDYRILLFDLDGTLTDSENGILNCVKHALESAGRDIPDDAALRAFIGPPLLESFQTVCGMSYEDAEAAVVKYRERYNVKGLFENRVYDGIPELLNKLNSAGYRLAVATSKPEAFALRILEHFGILGCFEAVAGCSLEKEGETKADMIRLAMERLHLTDDDKPYVLMIGDRKHDVLGARECGIDCAGVLYGFSPEGELQEYGAHPIAEDVEALGRILLGQTCAITM